MSAYRRSPAENEISEYMAAVQRGTAGVNPAAQTLARSRNNPRAAAAGARMIDAQMRDNAAEAERQAAEAERQAKAAATEAERQAKAAATAQAKEQREAEARAVRAAAAAGAKIETDIGTGRRSIATRPDGTPIAVAGPVGPVEDRDFATPGRAADLMLGGSFAGGTGGATEAGGGSITRRPAQTYRDENWNETTVPLTEKTDPKTGERYVMQPDQFGIERRRVVGIDQQAAARLAQAKEIDAEMQEIALRENHAAQLRGVLGTKWTEAKAAYEKATKSLETLEKKPDLIQDPATLKWSKKSTSGLNIPAMPNEVTEWKQKLENARAARDNARPLYDQLSPAAAQLESMEKETAARKLAAQERKLRLEIGLTDDDAGIARSMLAQTGQAGISDPEKAVTEVILAVTEAHGAKPAADAQPTPASLDPAPSATKPAQAPPPPEPVPAIPTPESGATPDEIATFREAFSAFQDAESLSIGARIDGQGAFLQRQGENIGFVGTDRKTGQSFFALNDNINRQGDIRNMVAFGGLGGIYVYLRDAAEPGFNGATRVADEAAWYSSLMADMQADESLHDDDAAMARFLEERGATPAEVLRRVNAGTLSVQRGEAIMRDLYGSTLKADDPTDQATFDRWLRAQDADVRDRWEAASAGKGDNAAANQIKSDYLSDWYAVNRHSPGITLAARRLAEAKLTGALRTGEKAAAIGESAMQAGGSMLGMLASPFAITSMGTQAMLMGDEDARKSLDDWTDNFGRSWVNTWRGWAFNFDKFISGEGKAIYADFQKAQAKLRAHIAAVDAHPEKENNPAWKAEFKSRVDAVTDAMFMLHSRRLEKGWEITRDDLDPDKNKALGKLLDLHVITGDRKYFEDYIRAIHQDHGSRQGDAFMSSMTDGHNPFMAGIIGGVYAPPQEMLVEWASTIATAGLGKLVFGTPKAAAAAIRAKAAGDALSRTQRFRYAMAGLADDYRALGMSTQSLSAAGKAPGVAAKARDLAARLGKVAIPSALSEGFLEEGAMSLADRTMTAESVAGDIGMGMLMGGILGTVIGGATGAASRSRANYDAAKRAEQFADAWNKTTRGTPGHVPMTPEDARAVMIIVGEDTRSDLVDRARQAVAEHSALQEIVAKGNPSPAVLAKLSRAKAAMIDANADLANYTAATAEAVSSIHVLPEERQAEARAYLKIQNGRADLLTPEERQAVAGKTTADGKAYFRSTRQAFDSDRGEAVALPTATELMTPAGMAEIAAEMPGLYPFLRFTSARNMAAKPITPTQQSNGQNTQGPSQGQAPATPAQSPPANPNAPGGVGGTGGGVSAPAAQTPPATGQAGPAVETAKQSPAATGTPTGSLPAGQSPTSGDVGAPAGLTEKQVANLAQMDAGQYEAARRTRPDLPPIEEIVAAAKAAGLPVSQSMEEAAQEQAAEQSEPEAAEQPAGSQMTPEDEAREMAEKIKARIEEIIPGLRGRIKIERATSRPTGGAAANWDGTISIYTADIQTQSETFDPQAVESTIIGIITDHEVTHIVQFDAVRQAWEESGSTIPYPEFWRQWHERILAEVGAETVAAAADLYNGTPSKAWAKLTADQRAQTQFGSLPASHQGAEIVRMLVEASRQGADQGRFSELMRAIAFSNSKTLVETLRRAVSLLVEMLQTGKLPESVQNHVDDITALYEKLIQPQQSGTQSEPTSQEITKDQSDARRVMSEAMDAALAANPVIAANEDMSIALDDAAFDLTEIMAGMPPENRRAFIDQAIADWIEENREQAEAEAQNQAESAQIEAAGDTTVRQKAKDSRDAYKRRLRDKARDLINSGNFRVLAAIAERGRIQPKPNAIPLILARKRSGKKLTEREIGILRNLSDWDGMPRKQDYPGGGNNAVVREILEFIFSKDSGAQMPNQMADDLIPGMATPSEMFEALYREIESISRGTPMMDEVNPDEIESAENIAKADAAAAAAEAEAQAAGPQSLPELAYELFEEFGEGHPLSAKSRVLAENMNRMDESVRASMLIAMQAEAGRIRANIPSAARWQEITEGWTDQAKRIHLWLSSQTAENIQAGLAKMPVLEEDDSDTVFSSAPAPAPFYSQLSRAIEAKMPKTAPIAQVVSIARDGAKAEEVKWSGLIPWLQANASDGKVSKEAVMKYLADEGAVRFEEVVNSSEGGWAVSDGESNQYFPTRQEAETYARAQGINITEDTVFPGTNRREPDRVRHGQHTLPGGENYREVVLAMPNPPVTRKKWGVKIDMKPAYGDEFRYLLGINFDTKEEAEAFLKEKHSNSKNPEVVSWEFEEPRQPEYTSSHFSDVPNYVAHMRLNERDGGLFIEELQSDRHQAGRKQGYAEPVQAEGEIPSGYRIEQKEGGLYALYRQSSGYESLVGSFRDRNRAVQQAFTDENSGKVADAPFRTTWPLALFKRALRDAVAGGKTWIGWTTGETQNDRFDLSKQVDSIGWIKDGTGASLTVMKGGSDVTGDLGLNRRVPLEELPDIIGKEAATKIIEGGRTGKLAGDDLKVGGSGMKGFYDNILPKEIGKYVKQWGAKVTQSTLPDGTPIWRIDITPAMKSGVEAGQALFSSAPQGSFDFGATGDMGTKAQRGLDFGGSFQPDSAAIKRQENAQKALDAAKTDQARENILQRVAETEGRPYVKPAIGGQGSFDFGVSGGFGTKSGQLGLDFAGRPVVANERPVDARQPELTSTGERQAAKPRDATQWMFAMRSGEFESANEWARAVPPELAMEIVDIAVEERNEIDKQLEPNTGKKASQRQIDLLNQRRPYQTVITLLTSEHGETIERMRREKAQPKPAPQETAKPANPPREAPAEIVAEYLDTLQSLPEGADQLRAQGMILKEPHESKALRLEALERQYPGITEQSADLQSERVKKRRAEKAANPPQDAPAETGSGASATSADQVDRFLDKAKADAEAWMQENAPERLAVLAENPSAFPYRTFLFDIPLNVLMAGNGRFQNVVDSYAARTDAPPIDVDVTRSTMGGPEIEFTVGDGNHRTAAAKKRGDTTIRAFVTPWDSDGMNALRDLVKSMHSAPAAPSQAMTQAQAAKTITKEKAAEILKESEALKGRPIRTYEQAVAANQVHMGTRISEWSAFPFSGEAVEGGPVQDTSGISELSHAPTMFPTGTIAGQGNCEWCGHQPIKGGYHIKHDGKKWTMVVGSECIMHFAGISGNQMAAEAKESAAIEMLKAIGDARRQLIKEFQYTSDGGYGRTTYHWRSREAEAIATKLNNLRGKTREDSGRAALSRWMNAQREGITATLADYAELMAKPENVATRIEWRERALRGAEGRAEAKHLNERDRQQAAKYAGQLRAELAELKSEKPATIDTAAQEAATSPTNNTPETPSRNINARHSVPLSSILTPAGAIKAASLRSDADSAVWHYQGDVGQLAFNVNATFEGKSYATDYQKNTLAQVKAAKADGWSLQTFKAGSFGSMKVFVKGDQVLTNAGAEALVSGKFAAPETLPSQAGAEGIIAQQAEFASRLVEWLATLPESTLNSPSALGNKATTTKVSEWFEIERRKNEVVLWMVDKTRTPKAGSGFGVIAIRGTTLEEAINKAVAMAANKRDGMSTKEATAWSAWGKYAGVDEAATIHDALVAAGFKQAEAVTETTPETSETPETLEPEPTKLHTAPVTDLDSLIAQVNAMVKGETTADAIRAAWAWFKDNKAQVHSELGKLTMKQLERFQGMRRPDNKADAVRSALHNLLTMFNPTSGYSINPMGGNLTDKIIAAMDEKMPLWTDEMLAETRKNRAERLADEERARTNPETKEEWESFVYRAGRKALTPVEVKEIVKMKSGSARVAAVIAKGEKVITPEQLAAFDAIRGIDRKAAAQQEAERKAMVRGVKADTDTEIIETKHTKTGEPLFVVRLADRVERDVYNSLNAAAKRLGGWYSSYRAGGAVPGFQFKTRENAEQFQAVSKGETVDRSEQLAEKKEARKSATADKLRAVADRMDEAAEKVLAADRKTNTAKRAREAGYAEANANSVKAMAATMRNLADAIESGEATHLDGVTARTHVETLQSLSNRAKSDAENAENLTYSERENRKGENPTPEQIDKAKYPWPFLNDTAWQWLIENGKNTPGAVRDTKRIESYFANRPNGTSNGSYLAGPDIIATVKGILSKINKQDYTRKNIEDAFSHYDRLQVMGLTDLPMLRAALREFLQYRGTKAKADPIKAMERELVGMKIEGFFPTPQTIIERMLDEVGHLKGKRVLEPSAGKGDIVEAAQRAGATVDAIEQQSRLRDILDAKGANLTGRDFMDVEPSPDYDAVLMNPPFENGQDAEHVMRAFQFLKPGGKLVAITGEGIFFRSDAKARAFREWLEENGGTSESLPEGSFKSSFRPTGVNTRLVVVEKPADALFSSAPDGDSFSREKAEILKTAPRGKDGHPLAPNGERSKLTEDQWAAVRTKAFKRWFGDWQAEAEDAAWKTQVAGYFANPNQRQMLPVGSVPSVLRAVGVSDARLLMPPSVIGKVTGGKHTLTREMVEQIPAALRDPIFVFDSASEANAVTVLTEMRHEGKNVLAAIHLDRKAPREAANLIVSLHERPASQVQGWIKMGLLRYSNQQKARAYFQSARLQSPREGSKAGNGNLLTEADVVNRTVNPETVSKVVDENGEPMVVHHGSAETGIEAFDAGKAGTILYSDWGRGIYFTPSKWMADSYRDGAAKKTNSAVQRAWDAMEEAAKRFGTDTMSAWIDMNAGRITADQFEQLQALEAEWRKELKAVELEKPGAVYSAFLRIRKPYNYTYGGITEPGLAERAQAEGYDGVIIRNESRYIEEIAVFDPNQVKSATDNNGDYSESDSMLFSSAPQQPDLLAAATAPDATQKLGDVKVGRMNALAAYRALTAKRDQGQKLTAKEEQQLLDAETALGQKLAFDMESVKADAPPITQSADARALAMMNRKGFTREDDKVRKQIEARLRKAGATEDLIYDITVGKYLPKATVNDSLTVQPAAKFGQNRRTNQEEMLLTGGTAPQDPSGQMRLFSSAPPLPPKPPSTAFERAAARITEATGSKTGIRQNELFDEFFTEELAKDDAYDAALNRWVDAIPENKPITFINSKWDSEMPSYYTVTKNTTAPDRPWRTTYFHTQKRPDWTIEEEIEYEDLFKKTRWVDSRNPEWQKWNDRLFELGSRPTTTNAKRIVPAGHEEAKTRVDAVKHALSMAGRDSTPVLGALFSSSPQFDPVEMALAKMPPIYRDVFLANQDGATVEEIMQRFPQARSPKAVANILRDAGMRVQAATMAAQGTLQPKTKDGLFDGGRPDLAEGANPDFVAIDQMRNEEELPDVRTRDEVYEAADAALAADYEGQFARLEGMAREGKLPNDVDIAIAKEIFRREAISRGLEDPERRARLALFRVSYRSEMGTEQARAFAMRRDEAMPPTARNAMMLTELLYEPSPSVQKRVKANRKDPAVVDAIIKQWMEKIDRFKAEMKEQGYDIDASLQAFRDHQQELAEGERIHAGTKEARDEAFLKLRMREKIVIRLMIDGAKVSAAQNQTGYTKEQIREIHQKFTESFDKSLEAAARRFIERVLAASAPQDVFQKIKERVGWQSWDDFDDTAPDYKEKQEAKRKEEKRQARKPKAPKPAAPKISTLTPEQQAALDEAFERFQNTPPAKWIALFQTETKRIAPMVGQVGFEEWKGEVLKPWRDLYQQEMATVQNPAARMSFEEWIQQPPATWRATLQTVAKGLGDPKQQQAFEEWQDQVMKPWRDLYQQEMDAIQNPSARMTFEEWVARPIETWTAKQITLLDERQWTPEQQAAWEAKTKGTFHPADPKPMSHLANEWSRRNGTWMNKIIEWFKMAILSGFQTMLVNASGGLFVAQLVGPQRVVEASWNSLLSLFGAGDVRAATFSEFRPMVKNVNLALQTASTNALEAWKLESPVFESYALAKHVQLEFSGVGAEYQPPALGVNDLRDLLNDPSFKTATGYVNRVMRNITFRELTAVDEFWKGLYSQLEVAAISHRMAAKEEKLTGKAYSERVEALMQPGSAAWRKAVPLALKATFQDKLAYGKWTAEDEKRNPAHKAGTRMSWDQAFEKSKTQSLWTVLDAVAAGAMDARKIPFIGPVFHMFALPFILTPKNIIQRGMEVTPLGLFVDLIDGSRAFKRRFMSGQLTKEEAKMQALELYNKARFIQLLTNQTMGLMILMAVASMIESDDDDEWGRPHITGTTPYMPTNRGERENMEMVMPAQSIRIGNTVIPYGRIEPIATYLSAWVSLAESLRRNEGVSRQFVTDMFNSYGDQFENKLFLKGIGDILTAVKEPERRAERLLANYAVGFVPNVIRQPIREMDSFRRDTNPMAEDGFFEALGKRVGYSLIPQTAPVKYDVFGEPVPANPGGKVGGVKAIDTLFRMIDPTNARVGLKPRPLDAWIFRYNHAQPDPSKRINITAIERKVTFQVPGEDKRRTVTMTESEYEEANRTAGRMAKAALSGMDWNTTPTSDEMAQVVVETIKNAQAAVNLQIRRKKMAKALENQ